MLQITNSQMHEFSKALTRYFENDALLYLKENYPGCIADKSDDTLRPFIRNTIGAALKYNIKEKEDVLTFIDLTIWLGAGFEKDPANTWAANVINVKNISGTEKAAELMKRYNARYKA